MVSGLESGDIFEQVRRGQATGKQAPHTQTEHTESMPRPLPSCVPAPAPTSLPLQVPRKFTSKQPGKMGYEDFVWFILSEEDKTSDTAIEYWFKVRGVVEGGPLGGGLAGTCLLADRPARSGVLVGWLGVLVGWLRGAGGLAQGCARGLFAKVMWGHHC